MKLFKTKRHIAIWFLIGICQSVAGQNISFRNYTPSDGLVHKTVYNIIRDTDGFVWVATSNGLSRFDSYKFENYTHIEGDSLSVQGTSIYGIAEGRERKIWLSTDAGIEYFDKTTEQFHRVENSTIKDNVFRKDIWIDEHGVLWAFNQNLQIIAYDPQLDSVTAHIQYSDWKVDASFRAIHFAVSDSSIWLASNQGIARYNLRNKQFRFIDQSDHIHCHSIRMPNEHTVVATYMFEGIYVLNTQTEQEYWVHKDFIKKQTGELTSMYDATIDADSALWVSVAPGMVRIQGNQAEYYNYTSQQRYFDGDVVSCFYLDKEGNLWIGTYEHGIFLRNKKNENFSFAPKLHKKDIKKTIITSFDVFEDGSLLYNDSRGAYICDNYKKMTVDCASKIFSAAQPKLFPLDKHHSLLSEADTFYLYNALTNSLEFSHYAIAPACLSQDKNGLLWMGTWNGYLNGYTSKGKKIQEIIVDTVNTSATPVYTICSDPDGSLWLGTYGIGLAHISAPTSKKPVIEYYNKKKNNSGHLNSNTINSLYIDSNGNLWIGTDGGGLIKRDKNTLEFETFTTENGLKSNVIESIISDNDGNIWFASDVLSKYDISNKTFTHYSSADGIAGSFAANACARSATGDLLFATSNGLYCFDPNDIKGKASAKTPVLTGLRLQGIAVHPNDTINGIVPYTQAIPFAKRIELPHQLNSFAIEFASISIHESKLVGYEYMLENFDKNWIPAEPNLRLASYANINPGDYCFKVRASFDSENWSPATSTVIRIIPPWWDTLLFKIALYSVLVLFIASTIARRVAKMRNEKKHLEALVSERTEELRVSNEQLKDQSLILQEQNESLENSKLLIELNNQELTSTLELKNKLIGIISHDFKNTLTTLLNAMRLIKSKIEEKQISYTETEIEWAHNLLCSAERSAQKLSDQMIGVLDWAHGQINKGKTNLSEVNLESLLIDTIQLSYETLRQKDIKLTTQLDYQHNALVDPRMIASVFRNLLFNAIKFTPTGGNIIITMNEEDNRFELSFIDTGLGMDADKANNLFEQYDPKKIVAGTQGEKGIGLGLQICKSFVQSNNGTIAVKSTPGEGSIFTITLPKGKNKAHKVITRLNDKKNDTELLKIDKSKTILIVDDNEELIRFLYETFTPRFNVIKATDGKQAYRLAKSMVPNIIISDIKMSEMNGLKLCQSIRNNNITSHIPVILLSAEKKETIEHKCYQYGASDFIEKPFDHKILEHKVDAFMNFSVHKNIAEQPPSIDHADLPESADEEFHRKITKLVNANISNPKFDIDSIAEEIGFSRTQLWRKTKTLLGKTPSELLRDMRIEKAISMLESGKYRISEIAYYVGYNNPRAFYNNFSSIYGMTPKEYMTKYSTKKTD